MKIVVSIALDGRSAGSWYAIETARRFAARGHEVLFIPRPRGQTIASARDAGLKVVDDLDLEEKSPGKMYGNLRRITQIIGSFGPDVALAHWGEDHSLWGMAKAMRASKMALIRVRALDPKPPKRHPLSRWLNRRATDQIVTVNTRLHSAYRDRLKIPTDRLSIIEAGIDPKRWESVDADPAALRRIGVPTDRPVVVLLARFSPVKGHRIMLSALPRILDKHPKAHFLWIGLPSEYQAAMFKRWFVEGNLLDAVTVVDEYQSDLPAILKASTIGLVTSIGSESVSRSQLEYMAAGLPSVATDVGGIADLMGRGDFGRLVPPANPIALATAINELLDDEKRSGWMGQAAKDYVHTHCTWDQRVDQWEELLYRVVSRVRGDSIPQMTDGEPPCENTVAAIKSARSESPPGS